MDNYVPIQESPPNSAALYLWHDCTVPALHIFINKPIKASSPDLFGPRYRLSISPNVYSVNLNTRALQVWPLVFRPSRIGVAAIWCTLREHDMHLAGRGFGQCRRRVIEKGVGVALMIHKLILEILVLPRVVESMKAVILRVFRGHISLDSRVEQRLVFLDIEVLRLEVVYARYRRSISGNGRSEHREYKGEDG